MDLKPYKQSFKQFGQYMEKFLADLSDPGYVSTLYKAETSEGDPLIGKDAKAKTFFTETTCRQLTYKCRIQNQFVQLKREAAKINQIYLETYRKFLRAIDHMEYHPTLDRTKTESTVRLKSNPMAKTRLKELPNIQTKEKGYPKKMN